MGEYESARAAYQASLQSDAETTRLKAGGAGGTAPMWYQDSLALTLHPIGTLKLVDGIEYEWTLGASGDKGHAGWYATGKHSSGLTNTPRRGEPEGSRDRAKRRPPRLETDSSKRKGYPIYSGVIRYFPDALAAVAMLSKVGNDKHNPNQPLHWARSKSTDELDCLVRHLAEAGTKDTDGIFHDVKVAWRALSNLQKLLEREGGLPISPGSRE